MDFELRKINKAIELMIKNQVDEAIELVSKDREDNMSCAFAYGIIDLLKRANIDMQGLKGFSNDFRPIQDLIQKNRKVQGWLSRTNFEKFTDENAHAELYYAETSIILGVLTIFDDRSFMGFVNGALYMRQGHSSYNTCLQILAKKSEWKSDHSKMQFESGTRLGAGLFEIGVSFLPTKLTQLLEYIGFSSNRDNGLAQLDQIRSMTESIRFPFIVAALIIYNFADRGQGLGETNPETENIVLNGFLRKYPDTDYSKFITGMLKLDKGDLVEACDLFEECKGSSGMVNRFDVFTTYFQYGCYLFSHDYEKAMVIAKEIEMAKWSPATGSFARGAVLATVAERESDPVRKNQLIEEAREIFEKVPTLKKNFGGKRAFAEKVVLNLSPIYAKEPERMIMPMFNNIYLFNYFDIFARRDEHILPIVEEIQWRHDRLRKDDSHYYDKHAYLTFFKGVCLRKLRKFDEAIECFKEVRELKKKIDLHTNLIPQACFEMAQVYRKEWKDYDLAKKWYHKAMKYRGHVAEVMIDWKCQLALDTIKKVQCENNN